MWEWDCSVAVPRFANQISDLAHDPGEYSLMRQPLNKITVWCYILAEKLQIRVESRELVEFQSVEAL